MSDGESTPPARRTRPSYGLPGPTSPAPGGDGGNGTPASGSTPYGAPAQGGSHGSQPYGSPAYGTPAYGSPAYGEPSHSAPSGGEGWAPQGPQGPGQDPYQPLTGPLPGSGGPATAPRGRRRGLLPLLIGLVLLLVIGPAAAIGGILWSVGSLAGDATTGPNEMGAATAEVEVEANNMLLVYVPQADSSTAECTAEGSQPGAVSSVPSSTAITFGDGSEYVQTLGVAALEDTTVTISCTGTDAPAYLGPYSLFKMAGPLLIGPIIGVVAGLIGLVLTIVGIVLLVRSRRS